MRNCLWLQSPNIVKVRESDVLKVSFIYYVITFMIEGVRKWHFKRTYYKEGRGVKMFEVVVT